MIKIFQSLASRGRCRVRRRGSFDNSARCAMVFSGTPGCPVSGLAVPCQGEGVGGSFHFLLAGWVNVGGHETLISRVHLRRRFRAVAVVLSTRTMSARMGWDRRILHWLSLWVMTREAAWGSVSLGPQDHHGTYRQPREIRSHRQSWSTTKSLILPRSGMAGRAASCQPYSAEMGCRRIRF